MQQNFSIRMKNFEFIQMFWIWNQSPESLQKLFILYIWQVDFTNRMHFKVCADISYSAWVSFTINQMFEKLSPFLICKMNCDITILKFQAFALS